MFAFINDEIINCLPCDSFPKRALEELALESSRGKIFLTSVFHSQDMFRNISFKKY